MRDGDAQAVRPDESAAVGSNESKQVLLPLAAVGADLCEAGRDDAEGLDPSRERRLGGFEHELGRQADDREVDHVGHVRDRRVRGHAADGPAIPVDRIGRTGEVGGQHVPEELAADRATAAGRPDHGNRFRLEERAERGGHREVVALVDARAVLLGGRDREADLELARVQLSRHLQAGALEHSQHRRVVQLDLRDEALDAFLGGERGEPLEQAGTDPASLQLVRDGERGLRGSRVAQAVVLADRHDPLVAAGAGQRADEHAALPPVGLEEMDDELLVDSADAMETLVEAAFGEAGEKGSEGSRIVARGCPQPERRAVAENDVDRGARLALTRGDRQAQPPPPLGSV